ncbi:hypothetical protein SERLA73DRAFT_186247 [Serpula lacrymans var. lacrymans S7.3]|uniref:Uncharacterized protein n=2 Tax=Serpula lacrymans var. lacrymans TaxID=341189 RepID=F8Q5L8_SERL3|nr:uncharacterized protein SERLADRAFT_475190 [Serpula lacrymans var. lacrymans S7.9]EGN96489.1 hypothetical protein SERLA73DRAFT_186247 [Serpula lacrymans var. lacrymans S7.3]EGO22036.1 hypothetical protein SERLADRAFT_475190 [Serpula lacrymans var. lacrymans S7.9]
MDAHQNWQQQQQLPTASHTIQSLHLPPQPHTTLPFPSIHRPSPTHSHHHHNNNNNQPRAGPSHHRPQTLASDLSREQTASMIPHDQVALLANTSTAQNHVLNLDASPSWSSAMTQMQIQEFDHLYRLGQQDLHHARLPHPDSSHPHQPSHSSIEPPSQATHYSQELHRQQLEQLRRQQQQQQRMEQARRRSEEAEYLQQFAATYPPHHHHQQHQYFPLTEEPTQLHHYQTHHGAHDLSQAQLPSPPLPLDPQSAYTQARHPHLMQRQQHYLGEEGSLSAIKYESPSVLHTPPLLLE